MQHFFPYWLSLVISFGFIQHLRAQQFVNLTDQPDSVVRRDIEEPVFAEMEPWPLNYEEVIQQIGYSDSLREEGIEGLVVIRLRVNAAGTPDGYQILQSSDSSLDQLVLAKADKLRFAPAFMKGEPLAFWINIPFSFRARHKSSIDIQNYFLHGVELLQSQDWAEAASWFEQEATNRKKPISPSRVEAVASLVGWALAEIELQRYQEAERHLNRALKLQNRMARRSFDQEAWLTCTYLPLDTVTVPDDQPRLQEALEAVKIKFCQ